MKSYLILDQVKSVKIEPQAVAFDCMDLILDELRICFNTETLAAIAKEILLKMPYLTFEKVFDTVDQERHDVTYKELEEKILVIEAQAEYTATLEDSYASLREEMLDLRGYR